MRGDECRNRKQYLSWHKCKSPFFCYYFLLLTINQLYKIKSKWQLLVFSPTVLFNYLKEETFFILFLYERINAFWWKMMIMKNVRNFFVHRAKKNYHIRAYYFARIRKWIFLMVKNHSYFDPKKNEKNIIENNIFFFCYNPCAILLMDVFQPIRTYIPCL